MIRSENSEQSDKLIQEFSDRFRDMDPEIHWPHCVVEQEAHFENLVRRQLAPETAEALSLYARKRNATLFALLLALYQSSIHALSGQRDLTVGVPVSSRPLYPQAEDLIGFLVVTAPFRTCFDSELTLDALMADLQQHSLSMLDRREIPLDSLARLLDRQREQSGKPMFQALFAMENSMSMSGAWRGNHYELEQLFNGSHKFDALLFCFNRPGQGLEVILEYDPDKPGRHTAELLADIFVRLAESLASESGAGPEEPLIAMLVRQMRGSTAAITANRERGRVPACFPCRNVLPVRARASGSTGPGLAGGNHELRPTGQRLGPACGLHSPASGPARAARRLHRPVSPTRSGNDCLHAGGSQGGLCLSAP